jgi:hypothetical protein|nr:MAG TPA: hypothetical protein [Caudoviricetes sp.]DAT04265.1 MAG TPA: hypothetical protein [Caudoviricetes sp.]
MSNYIKQRVYVGIFKSPVWVAAEEFGFFYPAAEWDELNTEQQAALIEKEVVKYVTATQKLIERGEKHLRFEVTASVGNHKKAITYDVPREQYENALFPRQKKELMMIYAMSLITWECEGAKNE